MSPAKVEGGQAPSLLGKEEEGQANTGVNAGPVSILKRWEKLHPTFSQKSCNYRIWFLPLIQRMAVKSYWDELERVFQSWVNEIFHKWWENRVRQSQAWLVCPWNLEGKGS